MPAAPVHGQAVPRQARGHHRSGVRGQEHHHRPQQHQTADLGHCTLALIQAGQESFQAITRGYYRSAVGAIVCYDVSSKESFNHISKWLADAQANGPSSLNFILVGNKSDKQAE